MQDPYDLARFVNAQASVYAEILAELGSGRKRSHWMWFVFPQLRGLGRSETARRFGIGSLDEARAYAAHEVLGPSLIACTGLVLDVQGRSAYEIFGSPDDLKFHSSMTLFARAEPARTPFAEALGKYFAGQQDERTLSLLSTA